MLYYNANIYKPESGFEIGSFNIENGKFANVSFKDSMPSEGINLNKALVIPGLIDMHTHGNSNADFSDGKLSGLKTMARYLLTHGITSFLPTSMTLPYEILKMTFDSAAMLQTESSSDCSEILGIHMEGPYLSEKYKGSQNPDYLRSPEINEFLALQDACGGLIRIVDLAPELENSPNFIKAIASLPSSNVLLSIAHTGAGYDTAKTAFLLGVQHVTHLFNAMPPLHHREPGVIGAAAEQDDITVELICDGIHIHPSVIKTAFKLFPHRICLISDAIRCCGMPEGEYSLGGQKVFLQNGEARLSDGSLAGSTTNLFECMKKAISFGIPVSSAIEAATLTPARCLGLSDKKGAIQNGNDADFLVCDSEFNIKKIYKRGKICIS